MGFGTVEMLRAPLLGQGGSVSPYHITKRAVPVMLVRLRKAVNSIVRKQEQIVFHLKKHESNFLTILLLHFLKFCKTHYDRLAFLLPKKRKKTVRYGISSDFVHIQPDTR